MACAFREKIGEAQAKLDAAQAKLDQLDILKAKETELRHEVAKQKDRIAELEKEAKADNESKLFFGKEDCENAEDSGVFANGKHVEAKDPEAERKSRLKALNKKLGQIQKLKEKDGTALDAEARAKVASEASVREEISALERGETFIPPQSKAPAEKTNSHVGETLELPTDPAEVEKRLKNLRKKLQQISDLKSKGNLDADAAAKVASERRFMQEIDALERGDSSVTIVDDSAEAHLAEKIELEKKLKSVRKKIDQIDKLKEKQEDELDTDAKAKIAAAPALRKEANMLQDQIGALNKKERERVAKRLGWEEDVKADQKAAKGKKSK
jgi:hypothetical protein